MKETRPPDGPAGAGLDYSRSLEGRGSGLGVTLRRSRERYEDGRAVHAGATGGGARMPKTAVGIGSEGGGAKATEAALLALDPTGEDRAVVAARTPTTAHAAIAVDTANSGGRGFADAWHVLLLTHASTLNATPVLTVSQPPIGTP